jgi:hypothetical protein
MAKDLCCEDFLPHVDRSFAVEGWHLKLTLARADFLPQWQGAQRSPPPFILIFRGPPGEILPEGTHTIATADGAAFTLYLVPIHTPAPDRQDYQAVFN